MYESIDCAGLMKRINEKMEKKANKQLTKFGVTFSQMQIMMALYHVEENAAPLKELEKYFEVAQSTAAGVVIRLEKKGLVSSFTSSEDKRLKIIQLTDEGKKICMASAEEITLGEESPLLSGLNSNERVQFLRLLTKVNNTLS